MTDGSASRQAPMDVARMILSGEMPAPTVARTVGFELVHVEPGRAVMVIETSMERHANPMGTLHGGILCDIADAAMGAAYGTTLEPGETFTTLELKINFLKPIWNARLEAVGRVVKRGQTIGLAECDITDADGNLVARASSTLMILRGAAARGRQPNSGE